MPDAAARPRAEVRRAVGRAGDAAAKAARSDRSRAEARLGWYLAGPAFVVMLAVTLYPILQAVYDSLFNYKLTAPDDRSFVGLNNYVVILTDSV
ncbi:ABC transporter permease, partial [Cellulosimicrobium sp. MM]